jgi:hypothetical protein
LLLLRSGCSALLAMLFFSCAGLPPLQPVGDSSEPDRYRQCSEVFPAGRWRLVHAIETVIADRSAGVVVGVTVVDPQERAVEAIILSIEGLVMFHARASADTIDIQRAIAPFDSPHFARALIGDVTLLFLAPQAVKMLSGLSAGGNFTCRFIRADGSAVDVVPGPAGGWKLREYDRRGNLRRRATASPSGGGSSMGEDSLPCRIELEAVRQPAYTLKMSLIEAERGSGYNQ